MKTEERELQIAIVRELRVQFALFFDPQPIVISNHNNAYNVVSGMLAKSLGRLAGVPDLTVYFGKSGTLFIEVKTARTKLSKEQETMIGRLEAFGFDVLVCRTVQEALEKTLEYIKMYDVIN